MTEPRSSETLQWQRAEALDHMEKALELLDACDPDEIAGAHLDHAICRVKALIEQSS